MKRKSIVCLIFILFMPILIPTAHSDQSAIVAINPTDSYVNIGQTFSANVTIANVANLTSWQFTVYFLNSVLTCTNAIEGPFLKSAGGTFFGDIIANSYNSTHGRVVVYDTLLGTGAVANGDGVLASVIFQATGPGNFTALVLANTKLGDQQVPPNPIPNTTVNGAVHVSGFTTYPVAAAVGITGYKLVFNETMKNWLNTPVTINYYWDFTADKWNGTQWVASDINGSTTFNGYSIPALATVNLPCNVYVLNPSTVAWGDWLRISFTFHWSYSSTTNSVTHPSTKLHVHPADIAGVTPVAFPYLGADGAVGTKDLQVLGVEWTLNVGGADPLSNLARADMNGDGKVGTKDLQILGFNWGRSWTNSPPPG